MIRSIGASICAVALLTATATAAEEIVQGTVRHVDERAGIIVLEDGRTIRLDAVTPGTRIVVITADPGGGPASPRLAPATPMPPRGDRPHDASPDRGWEIQAP